MSIPVERETLIHLENLHCLGETGILVHSLSMALTIGPSRVSQRLLALREMADDGMRRWGSDGRGKHQYREAQTFKKAKMTAEYVSSMSSNAPFWRPTTSYDRLSEIDAGAQNELGLMGHEA